MCGRFQLSVKGKHISERFNVEVFDELYKPSFNCAPGQILPVITNAEPGKLSLFKWGLVPFWAKDPKIGNKLINTRAETILEKPSFKAAFTRRRCLVPANGFFEWKKDSKKIPFRIFLKNEALFAMAGLWETWKDEENNLLHTFSIITTEPNKLMTSIHNRMPVILNREQEMVWLKSTNKEELMSLLAPFHPDKMEVYPIGNEINSPGNNYEALINPKQPDNPLLPF
ncbi:MAG: SOS response-associated peptidase [Bacteroidales bacterium]|jgi:putative SOS response-associated peptidase YedK